ncbi:unnamed protein product [Mycena citricolor]|uniref:PHD-type domain-containing protein n=1 Tax=Mycena citricolor TaxID=2018698 RepID=A0AAD2K527_9AGAR|nr:unnamed protein product [Mycena citricolor]
MAATSSLPLDAYIRNLPGVPVHQPPHLEGDSTLATEILPGPPSLLSVQQQATQKRDPKKLVYSYLHPTDPGSSYSGIGHGTIVGQEEARNLNGKRSAVTGRAQRASARNQNGTATALIVAEPTQPEAGSSTAPQPISATLDLSMMPPDDDPSSSRSTSAPNVPESESSGTVRQLKSKGKSKGKGKAKDTSLSVRVKEEPNGEFLDPPELASSRQVNEDHCSSCRSHGALVYCDGCPRAFHLWCLNPPMQNIDEGDSHWFCPACVIRKHPPRRPPPGLFSPLIHLVQTTIPTEYQLPEDIRTFFKDVGTGPKGTYVDTSVIRQPRPNRFGLVDDRDAHRLRDKNGGPVLCFKCNSSALPVDLAPESSTAIRSRRSPTGLPANGELWKSILSCDFCDLHWHLDCLDPPLPAMPPINKKWMCPNHSDRVLASSQAVVNVYWHSSLLQTQLPKLRIPKQAAPIEITKPGQPNNGVVDIIHPQAVSAQIKDVQVDEVLINGRRYRVPERIVVLDFWNKVSGLNSNPERDGEQAESGLSSPLTSLSSLADADEPLTLDNGHSSHSADDLKAAQMLCNFQLAIHDPSLAQIVPRVFQQTSAPVTSKPVRTGALKRTASKALNGASQEAGPSNISAKRKRVANGLHSSVTPTANTRELRSRGRKADSVVSISSKESSLDDPFGPLSIRVKTETEEHENGFYSAGQPSESPVSKPSSRGRTVRRKAADQETPKETVKPSRKRKEREEPTEDHNLDDETRPSESTKKSRTERPQGSKGKGKAKDKGQPVSAEPTPVVPPTTPSFKIRLPPLSDIARTSPSTQRTVPSG